MKQLLILLCSILLLNSCNHKAANNSGDVKTDSTTIHVSTDALLQTYSAFIAAETPGSKEGIPDKVWNSKYYTKYAADLDSNFARIEKERLSLMRNWAKTELSDELAEPKLLFYPFSGPDILHAITLFPNAPQYVMVAMEPYGDIPELGKMDSAQMVYYLNSVKESLQDIFEKSYFITRKMVGDLQKQKVNGVTPLISLFLVQTGHNVIAIKKNHLNDDGTISELPADSLPKNLNDFIEIYFNDGDSTPIRKIQYFRANLGDGMFFGLPALPSNKPLQAYFSNLPEFYTYTKSASYLMNYKTFSAIRNICLTKSKSILQDDTGIGYQYFEKDKWNIKLYGRYVKPVKDFQGVYDSKLAEAYKLDSANVKPLAFSLGYHWGHKSDQNLIKAERK